MVGSTLGVYSFGLIFVSARTNKRHHHQEQRVILDRYAIKPHNLFLEFLWFSLIREKIKFMQSHTHHPCRLKTDQSGWAKGGRIHN
jgi:hypothetical protein